MQSNRQREIEELGGKKSKEKTDAEIVAEAFATYKERGEIPPIVERASKYIEENEKAEDTDK